MTIPTPAETNTVKTVKGIRPGLVSAKTGNATNDRDSSKIIRTKNASLILISLFVFYDPFNKILICTEYKEKYHA